MNLLLNKVLKRFSRDCHRVYRKFFGPVVRWVAPTLIQKKPEWLTIIVRHNYGYRPLPTLRQRIKRSNNPLDDFIFINYDAPSFDCVNLIFRGKTASTCDIDKSLPTLFVNPAENAGIGAYSRPYLCAADYTSLATFMGREYSLDRRYLGTFEDRRIFFRVNRDIPQDYHLSPESYGLEELKSKAEDVQSSWEIGLQWNFEKPFTQCFVLHRSGSRSLQFASSVAAIVYALNVSKKVRVFGWDLYMDRPVPEQFEKQVEALWSFGRNNIHIFATCLLNWIYAYRFMNDLPRERIEIFGRVEGIRDLAWVGRCGDRVLYE